MSSYDEVVLFPGLKLKSLAHAAGNYHVLLTENRKLFNEIQDLKGEILVLNSTVFTVDHHFYVFLYHLIFSLPPGNIRVYCRIRPFLTGQKDKRMTIEYIGENGEVVIANPTKPGKEGHKLFKFNKVYSPASTQGLFLFILSCNLVLVYVECLRSFWSDRGIIATINCCVVFIKCRGGFF